MPDQFGPLEETRGGGFHMVSEANGHRSREEIIVESGENLKVGTVLGKITASETYAQVDLAASDGSEVAAGILFHDVDATDADKEGAAHVRDCEVMGDELIYPDGADANDIATINGQLADLGIIVR